MVRNYQGSRTLVDKITLLKLDWICAWLDICVKEIERVGMEGSEVGMCLCLCERKRYDFERRIRGSLVCVCVWWKEIREGGKVQTVFCECVRACVLVCVCAKVRDRGSMVGSEHRLCVCVCL